MKKSNTNSILAAGVVTLLLFSGCASGIVSTFQSTTTDTLRQKNTQTNEDAIITCYVSGIPHSQTISYESGTYLKELFSELAAANAHDPCSTETERLQQQILGYAEQQGMLPAGMSADMVFTQLKKQGQIFATKAVNGKAAYPLGIGKEMFCNFVATGEGCCFPDHHPPAVHPVYYDSDPPVVRRLENNSWFYECWWSDVRDWFLCGWSTAGFRPRVLGYRVQHLPPTGEGVRDVRVRIVTRRHLLSTWSIIRRTTHQR